MPVTPVDYFDLYLDHPQTKSITRLTSSGYHHNSHAIFGEDEHRVYWFSGGSYASDIMSLYIGEYSRSELRIGFGRVGGAYASIQEQKAMYDKTRGMLYYCAPVEGDPSLFSLDIYRLSVYTSVIVNLTENTTAVVGSIDLDDTGKRLLYSEYNKSDSTYRIVLYDSDQKIKKVLSSFRTTRIYSPQFIHNSENIVYFEYVDNPKYMWDIKTMALAGNSASARIASSNTYRALYYPRVSVNNCVTITGDSEGILNLETGAVTPLPADFSWHRYMLARNGTTAVGSFKSYNNSEYIVYDLVSKKMTKRVLSNLDNIDVLDVLDDGSAVILRARNR